MAKPADLADYLFEGPHPFNARQLSGELVRWMEESSRFTSFVETYRDKIRKKIRVTRERESVLDLRSELEVAYLLLNDRRLAVAYEPYASEKRRGADFAVTYRANLMFNIEVARMRVEDGGERRLLRILLDKLGQMQPGTGNLLVVHARPELAQTIDLGGLMQALKILVEGKDPDFYAATRYSSPAAFYKDFLHLSGIVLRPAGQPHGPAPQLWINKQARPGLDEKVQRLVAAALQQGSPPLARG